MKKRYRDEKGRFCKQWQTPEAKAKAKARRQTPEYKAKERARDKARRQTPKHKARHKAYNKRPENIAKDKARQQTPEYKANQKTWRESPEGKALRRASQALIKAKRLKRHMLLDKAGRKAIAEIYVNCPDDWHVDHIVPILGKTISGLHVPENLQYLPDWVNHMKGNRWEESWAEHTIDTPLEEKIKAYQLNLSLIHI